MHVILDIVIIVLIGVLIMSGQGDRLVAKLDDWIIEKRIAHDVKLEARREEQRLRAEAEKIYDDRLAVRQAMHDLNHKMHMADPYRKWWQ